VWAVDFSPDDHTLYTTGGDGTVLTWDLHGDRRWIRSLPVAEPITNADYIVQASPTGEAIAYVSYPSSVGFVEVATGRAGPVIAAGHGEWGVFEWRPDGRRFATTGADGFVRVWDWPSGELLAERSVAPGHLAALDYTADGTHLLVGERAGRISMIDAETLEPAGTTVQLDLTVVFAYVAPNGRRAVAMSGDEFVVLDLTSGRVVRRGPTGFIAGYSEFSPDGRRFAMGGTQSGEVRLLDVDTGEWIGPARIAHSGVGWFTAYAPDGATFVTTGRDGRVALWDGHTGKPLGSVLAAPPGFINEARYLPDGESVLISALDGTISSWDITPERMIEYACQIAGRNLTGDEWRDALGTRPYRETCPGNRQP
jgi:WD40 repeat protein